MFEFLPSVNMIDHVHIFECTIYQSIKPNCVEQSCFFLSFVNFISLSKMTNKVDNEGFWYEFIRLYGSLLATWKIKSDLYKNRILKQECYVQLTNKLEEIDTIPDKNITKKKKINTLSSNYCRCYSFTCFNYNFFNGLWNGCGNELKFFKARYHSIHDKCWTDEISSLIQVSYFSIIGVIIFNNFENVLWSMQRLFL